MTSRQITLQEDTYFRMMRIPQENTELTQREHANKLSISVGAVNYCLKVPMEKSLERMKNFINSMNKFSLIYALLPGGMAKKSSNTHRFLIRKKEEYVV